MRELIPSSVRELIHSQLGRLTSSARALVVAGAALGQGLTFERLIQVAQLDEQEGLYALEELLRAGLMCEGTQVEEPQAVDGYAFPREMLREVVYQEAGVTRQKLVQRRVSTLIREEEVRLLHPASEDRQASTETRHEQGKRVVSETMNGNMYWTVAKDSSGTNRRQLDAGVGEQTLLTALEWGAKGHVAPDFLRSPSGSPFQSFS